MLCFSTGFIIDLQLWNTIYPVYYPHQYAGQGRLPPYTRDTDLGLEKLRRLIGEATAGRNQRLILLFLPAKRATASNCSACAERNVRAGARHQFSVRVPNRRSLKHVGATHGVRRRHTARRYERLQRPGPDW
jgi:hypothetical protein